MIVKEGDVYVMYRCNPDNGNCYTTRYVQSAESEGTLIHEDAKDNRDCDLNLTPEGDLVSGYGWTHRIIFPPSKN